MKKIYLICRGIQKVIPRINEVNNKPLIAPEIPSDNKNINEDITNLFL